jgi:hypothetical protein
MEQLIKNNNDIVVYQIAQKHNVDMNQLLGLAVKYNRQYLFNSLASLNKAPLDPIHLFNCTTTEMIDTCLEFITINQINEFGQTAAQYYITKHKYDLALHLIHRGTNVNNKSYNGMTMIDACINIEDITMARKILSEIVECGAIPTRNQLDIINDDDDKRLLFRKSSGHAVCCICFNKGTDVITTCNHEFHFTCIYTYDKNKCPTCRQLLLL